MFINYISADIFHIKSVTILEADNEHRWEPHYGK